MVLATSNAYFFNICSRLARYTGNQTYADYADKVWDWLYDIELIDHESWHVYQGTHTTENCTEINKVVSSIDSAILLSGAAFMYNIVSRPFVNPVHLY